MLPRSTKSARCSLLIQSESLTHNSDLTLKRFIFIFNRGLRGVLVIWMCAPHRLAFPPKDLDMHPYMLLHKHIQTMLKITTYCPVKGHEHSNWPSDRCSTTLMDCCFYMWTNSGVDPIGADTGSRQQESEIGTYRKVKAPEFMCVLSSIQEIMAAMQLVTQWVRWCPSSSWCW